MNQQQTQTYGDLVGQRLFGDYVVTRKLGEGGMGAVYLAQQQAINQDIAIKVLHGRAAESQEIVERFNREARVISMLTHPNIIRVFIFGRTPEDLMYLAMEYVKGRELREELRQGPMDELLAIKIMKQTCSALAEAHDLDIVHRDLKPDNILLTEFRGENHFVKILDFGIAKITNQEGSEKQLTQAGIVYGTPEYLSPEQAQAKNLDHRTDIYSLGVMLYELMTGEVPYKSSSAVEVLTMHVFNEPKPPSQVAPNRVSPTMEGIIMKAMAKDPDQRFLTALDMFKALVMREQEILRERGMGHAANYVPGSEMTGFFAAVPAGPTPQPHQSGGMNTPQPHRPSGPNPGFGAPQTQRAPVQQHNPYGPGPMQRPGPGGPGPGPGPGGPAHNSPYGPNPLRQGPPGPATGPNPPSGFHPQRIPETKGVQYGPPAQEDGTRKIIMGVIAVACVVLVFLLLVIAMLFFK
jgi:serine/threonine-protein kinase